MASVAAIKAAKRVAAARGGVESRNPHPFARADSVGPSSFKRAIDYAACSSVLAQGGQCDFVPPKLKQNPEAALQASRELTRANTALVGGNLFDHVQKLKAKQARIPSWLIDPRNSRIMPFWDQLMCAAIIFTAAVTPFEVALLPSPKSAIEPLFILNRLMDVAFLIDVGVNFVLIDTDGADSTSWAEDPKQIALNYLRGWFGVDVLSIAVSGVDIYALASASEAAAAAATEGDSGRLSALRTLRVLRALRLVKMLRMLRASRVLKMLQSSYAINYNALEFTTCIAVCVACAHWFACLWALQAALLHESVLDSWLGNYGYCEAIEDASGGGSFACPRERVCDIDLPGIACLYPGQIYSASVYWATATIVSVGYGDIGATPYNAAEQAACSVLMFAGGILWGYVVGTFVGVFAASAATAEFRQNMDDLNTFLVTNHVESSLKARLREYFHRTRHLHDADSQARLLKMMSPTLQSEVALEVHQKWVRCVWFLQRAEPEFVVRLALSLTPMVLAPFELAPPGFLYILYRGVVIHGAGLLVRGKAWGDDIILADITPSLIREDIAKAMNYAEVYVCSWSTLKEAAEGFPGTEQHIRRCGVRLAMRRKFIVAARQILMQRKADASFTKRAPQDRVLSMASITEAKGMARSISMRLSATDAEVTLQTQLMQGGVANSPPADSAQAGERASRRASRCNGTNGAAALLTTASPAAAPLKAAWWPAPAPASGRPVAQGWGDKRSASTSNGGVSPTERWASADVAALAEMVARQEKMIQALSDDVQMVCGEMRKTMGQTAKKGVLSA